MHILLTDRLECPRCGTGFGLVLFADDLRDRRVMEGSLGCANCRERYPVHGGVADFRPSPRRGDDPRLPPEAMDDEDVLRMGALLGVTEGPATVAVIGPPSLAASRLAALVPGLDVVVVVPSEGGDEAQGVSRVRVSERLPLQRASLAGVVLRGGPAVDLIDEAVRVVTPGRRVVVLDPPEGLGARLEAKGVDLLVSGREAVVGTVRSGVSA